VNLFEMVAEPIHLNRIQTEYRIVPDVREPLAYEVFSVERVVSTGGYLEGTVEFEPFYALRHAAWGAKPGPFWYALRKMSLRELDDGTDVELAFTDPNFHPASPSVETVTPYITCSNRDLPARLPFGGADADFLLESNAPVSRVRPLTRPTRTLRTPVGRPMQWLLISQLGLNHLSLVEGEHGPDALRELLELYDFSDSAVTRKMIGGIEAVSCRRVPGRTGNRPGNTLSLGVEVSVRFDEDAFAGANAFLLAAVLERFFGAYVNINSFTQMVATSKQREGTWKRWPPRCGDRTLL
jgi:type VI secretion system protein ImpG